MKRFFLEPVDGRKSFNGKCYVETTGSTATLYSYGVKICTYNTESGKLTKHKDFDYSATTKRHQKAFFNHYSISA